MAVELTYNSVLSGKETLSSGTSYISNPVVTHDGLNSGGTYTGATTVPVTKVASGTLTLSGGAGTINLASMTGAGGGTVDFTGLKVQFAKLKNTGAAAMTIVPGASNGIDLFGAASSLTIPAGGEVLMFFNEGSPDVASGDRTLDVSGTGTQALAYEFVAG